MKNSLVSLLVVMVTFVLPSFVSADFLDLDHFETLIHSNVCGLKITRFSAGQAGNINVTFYDINDDGKKGPQKLWLLCGETAIADIHFDLVGNWREPEVPPANQIEILLKAHEDIKDNPDTAVVEANVPNEDNYVGDAVIVVNPRYEQRRQGDSLIGLLGNIWGYGGVYGKFSHPGPFQRSVIMSRRGGRSGARTSNGRDTQQIVTIDEDDIKWASATQRPHGYKKVVRRW